VVDADVLSSQNSLTWSVALASERSAPYFKKILAFIEQERLRGKTIYPSNNDIFNALRFTPLESLRVVIIGQDPYHGPGQAHGLSFSVQRPVPPPPSLVNIYKELESDLGIPRANHGCLESWAKQGVLLLNSALTVEAGKPGSHRELGWQQFTNAIITSIVTHRTGVVFLLWGSHAQEKESLIDLSKHYVLKAPHPSPLSAYKGFLGCKHFSKTNEILLQQGHAAIDWRLP
jgi:uracil-DNA glycosylase